jgi:D-alanyl-D-alanine endopeptidase (penicillin-binding protein 7)
MPEARSSRVSSQRVRNGLRVLAAAFFATAFLCSAAQAATASKKKPAIAAKAKSASVEKEVRGGRNVVATYSKRGGKAVVAVQRRSVVRVAEAPPRPSFGQLAGLHGTDDVLDLKSSVALVVDQDTREVLLSKNEQAVLPIASITKLMTGVLISEAQLPSEEMITISQDDVDTEKHSSSRLRVGATLPRGELLHLALMSSENRAAHALGRTYPGGMDTFVAMMNAKARSLGMRDTRYVEPTGLSSANQSSARDLALLVNYAYGDPVLRQLTTSPERLVEVGSRTLQFNTTNRLVKSPDWDIGLQKTGYISEAGQCLVMQAKIAGRKVIMVFLDSAGKFSRLGDAERVRRWVEATHMMAPAASHTPVATSNVAG